MQVESRNQTVPELVEGPSLGYAEAQPKIFKSPALIMPNVSNMSEANGSNLLHDFRHRFSITHVNMVSAFTSH